MGLFGFITKDVAAEDESKRVIVVLRIIYLVMLIAFLIDTLMMGYGLFRICYMRIIIFFLANILLFVHTYYTRTKYAIWLFVLYLVLFMFFHIPCFGWIAGFQNWFIIILMLCFFAIHVKKLYKFLCAAAVLVLRIVVINLYGGIPSAVNVGDAVQKHLQIVNISAVFISIAVISYFFSQNDNEAEEKLVKYNDRLKKEANTDQLTGLFNRRKALEYLRASSHTKDDAVFSLAIGDIDFFKKVNDTYGHDAGDEVLRHVAKTMVDTCRSDSFIARWGGEEFLIIFPGCNGDHAFIALERLRRTIENQVIKVGEHEIRITMTFGLTEYDFNKDEESSIKEADEKLYQGKTNGRNQTVY